jgi:hypothetical protein
MRVSLGLILVLLGVGCGMRSNTVYNLNQTGAQFSNAQCSSIRLAVNESGGQISGTGSNPCFTQTLTGSLTSNGQMNVTLSLIPAASANQAYNPASAGMYGGNGGMFGASMNCSYQGVLTLSGNTIQGVLNPVSSFGYGCLGSISINGTRN